jgi:hypothetical protein
MFAGPVHDDHSSWRIKQEQKGAGQQTPRSTIAPEPGRSTGAGSGSDSARGEGGVSTGTAK